MNTNRITVNQHYRQQVLEELVSEHTQLYCGTMKVQKASPASAERLHSGISEIDSFLQEGLLTESLTEFGMPMGKEGRLLLMPFLRKLTASPQGWVLWAASHEDYQVFPPAWYAFGISPERMVFTESSRPVRDLKQAFLQPFFQLIVLDSPQKLTRDDLVFIHQSAEKHHITIWLIRPFFLSNRQGNIWARLRINSYIDRQQRLILKAVRGLSMKTCRIDVSTFRTPYRESL